MRGAHSREVSTELQLVKMNRILIGATHQLLKEKGGHS